MQEMPLLVFTILEQTAIGALAALVVMHLAGKLPAREGTGGVASDGGAKAAFAIAIVLFVLTLVAMGASLFHLGQPMRAANVMRGLGSSWLSREILFFGLFSGATLVYAILAKLGKDAAAKAVGVVAAVAGIMAVVSTSICYMQPGVPAWNSMATPGQFVLTTVVCGIPLYAALTATLGRSGKAGIWWAAFVVLLVSQIVMRWFFFSDIVLLIATV